MSYLEQINSVLRIFVYGTLKPGGQYHQQLCRGYLTEARPALAKGQLYDFPQLGYPAMVAGGDWVKGYILRFEQSAAICTDILSRLDALEGYLCSRSEAENDYQRIEIQPFALNYEPLPLAWAYQMTAAQRLRYGGVYLPQGEWLEPSGPLL